MVTQPPPSAWTGPVILTLCIAVLSLLVAAAALAWQVASWRRAGARVKVSTDWGIVGAYASDLWFVGITAINSGRLATEVHQIGFQLPRNQNRQQIVALEDVLGIPIQLPITLGPGASVSVRYSVPGLASALRKGGLTGEGARPFVKTGHGRKLGQRKHLGEMLEHLKGPVESG